MTSDEDHDCNALFHFPSIFRFPVSDKRFPSGMFELVCIACDLFSVEYVL